MSPERISLPVNVVLDTIKRDPQGLFDEIQTQIPQMLNLVNEWHEARPTLNINYEENKHFGIAANDFYKRQREYLGQAQKEAEEFYNASQAGLGKHEVFEELADVMFFLLARHENNDYLVGNMEVEFQELGYPRTLYDLRKLQKHSAEELVLSMVTSLNKKSEPEYEFAQADTYLILIYSLAFAYARLKKADIGHIFERTKIKNDLNYPEVFFNRMTPFLIETDARSFLRILRGKDPKFSPGDQVRDFFVNYLFQVNHHHTQEFRLWVYRRLTDIINQNRIGNSALRNEAWRLRETGRWDNELWPPFQTQRTPLYGLREWADKQPSVVDSKASPQLKMAI